MGIFFLLFDQRSCFGCFRKRLSIFNNNRSRSRSFLEKIYSFINLNTLVLSWRVDSIVEEFFVFLKVSTITTYFSFLYLSQYACNMLCTSTVCIAKVKHNSIFADWTGVLVYVLFRIKKRNSRKWCYGKFFKTSTTNCFPSVRKNSVFIIFVFKTNSRR